MQLLNTLLKLSKVSKPYGILGILVRLVESLKFKTLIILLPQVSIANILSEIVVPLVTIVSQIPEILIW